jgi:ribosome-interacting GTPase 1
MTCLIKSPIWNSKHCNFLSNIVGEVFVGKSDSIVFILDKREVITKHDIIFNKWKDTNILINQTPIKIVTYREFK